MVAVVILLFALFLGPNPAAVPKPTDEANRCNLRHVVPKTLQKALYVGFSQIDQPLQVVCFGWSQFPIPEVSSDRYLDAVERDLPRRLLELPGAQ